MSDAAKEDVVLLCSPGTGTSLEKPNQKCKTWCSTSMEGQKLAPRSLSPPEFSMELCRTSKILVNPQIGISLILSFLIISRDQILNVLANKKKLNIHSNELRSHKRQKRPAMVSPLLALPMPELLHCQKGSPVRAQILPLAVFE